MTQAWHSLMSGELVRRLGARLCRVLTEGQGMNELLHLFLESLSEELGKARLILYDYDETADHFQLLYFHGYPPDSRPSLNRKLYEMNVRHALIQTVPYWIDDRRCELLMPLYFQSTLEAVLVVELSEPLPEASEELWAAARLVSRFLGLFMSSSRLPINQKLHPVASQDLQRAREVQLAYLPSVHPATESYEIFAYNQSSALVGGDYFDYFCHDDQRIQCVVADACGHGMAAALIMSTFRGLLLSEVRQMEDPHVLFNRMNEQLYVSGEILQYLTTVFFQYSRENRQIGYLNAGHFDPLLVKPNGNSIRLKGGGPPLGMFKDSVYEMRTAEAQPGDLMVLFTDGLVELRNPQDDFFGIQGIEKSIYHHRGADLRQLASEVLNSASRFSGMRQPEDDLTLFLMRFR